MKLTAYICPETREMIDDQQAHEKAITLEISAWLSLYSGKLLTLIGLFDTKSSCFPSPDKVPQLIFFTKYNLLSPHQA